MVSVAGPVPAVAATSDNQGGGNVSSGEPRTAEDSPAEEENRAEGEAKEKEVAEQVRTARQRMTGTQRRQQLIEIGRALFAERGYDATSIEEIAQRALVSKPVVYEHFGGKEGLYAVVVDREMSMLLDMITSSLTNNRSRVRLEQVALALLTYIEQRTDGFRILVRDQPISSTEGRYSSLLNEAVNQVAHLLGGDFERRGFDTSLAGLYAQALVGMVATTATWWLDVRSPSKEIVATHLVNLCWNGLRHLEADPQLSSEWPAVESPLQANSPGVQRSSGSPG